MMIYEGLGNDSIIERNKARISYVKDLSKDILKLDIQVDELIHSLCCNDIKMINDAIAELFYEKVDNNLLLETIELFNKINDVDKFKYMIMNRYVRRPEKGFVWNCHNLLI
nr:hypothetical protein [uncultured Romboutsia sp.]